VQLTQPLNIGDHPWKRLPWVLSAALLVWVALLWILGFLLEGMDTPPQVPGSIDAQFIEIGSSGMQHEKSKSTNKSTTLPVVPPSADQTASPAQAQPDITQVKVNSQPSGEKAPGAVGSEDTGMASQASTASSMPPRFGAAYLNNPKPAYPAFAKRMRMEGTVLLKVLVSHEGTVLSLEVARSSGYEILDKAAAEAVRQWRFIPASRAFQPIDEWVQVPVAFRLDK